MLLNEVGRKNTFIISYKRQFVSEIAFYAEGHPTVHTLNVTGRRNSRYDPWEGFENKIGLNALYITKYRTKELRQGLRRGRRNKKSNDLCGGGTDKGLFHILLLGFPWARSRTMREPTGKRQRRSYAPGRSLSPKA